MANELIELTGEEFRRAARLGLGRAVLYARQPGAALDEDFIRELMLHNTAYDPQVEGTRGWYAVQLIEATGHAADFAAALGKALKEIPPNDDWDDVHRAWTAGLLIEAGHDALRPVLYDWTVANIEAGYALGTEALVSVDGAKAVTFLADHYRRVGYDLVDLYHSFIYIFDDDDAIHQMPVVQEMKALAEAQKAARPKAEPWCPTYRDFREKLAKDPESMWNRPGTWVREASAGEIEDAAAGFLALAEDDVHRRLAYVAVFTKRPYPLDPAPLISLARTYRGEPVWTEEHKLIPETMLKFRAFIALEKVNHADVRALALELIGRGEYVERAVGLLESNFQPGDWPLIAEVVGRDISDDDLHDVGLSVKRIAREHPDAAAVPALTGLIERDPCSSCRYSLLRALREIGPLPELYAREAHFDSEEDIRDWAEAGFPLRAEQD